MNKTEVFIFSYNRGKFLKNCVDSTVKYIPNAIITVIDDNSTDNDTINVLRILEKKGIVVKRPRLEGQYGGYGGYWQNLQLVIDKLAKADWVIFIEDDMQFTRPLIDQDVSNINDFFSKNEKSAYLCLEFFKEGNKVHDSTYTIVNKEHGFYTFKDGAEIYRGTIHCNNIGAIHINRMREKSFKIGNEEREHRNNAKHAFTKLGYYPYPLMMFLPFAPTTKNKNKTITRRLVERYYRTGFYPYQKMTEEKLSNFLNRDISILPYTGDWLTTAVPSPRYPFEYADSMKRVNKWVRRIEKLERIILKR